MQLFEETLKEIKLFTGVLICFIFIFALLYINGKIDFPGGTENFPPPMPYEIAILFYTMSNTIGDLNYPEYSEWAEKSNLNPGPCMLMTMYIWIIYIGGIYIMLIMMLNFLIAIMGAKVEEI